MAAMIALSILPSLSLRHLPPSPSPPPSIHILACLTPRPHPCVPYPSRPYPPSLSVSSRPYPRLPYPPSLTPLVPVLRPYPRVPIIASLIPRPLLPCPYTRLPYLYPLPRIPILPYLSTRPYTHLHYPTSLTPPVPISSVPILASLSSPPCIACTGWTASVIYLLAHSIVLNYRRVQKAWPVIGW